MKMLIKNIASFLRTVFKRHDDIQIWHDLEFQGRGRRLPSSEAL